jgi:hypothetical protein
MIHEDKSVSVIRTAENLDVVTAQEKIPEHLQQPYRHGVPADIINPR